MCDLRLLIPGSGRLSRFEILSYNHQVISGTVCIRTHNKITISRQPFVIVSFIYRPHVMQKAQNGDFINRHVTWSCPQSRNAVTVSVYFQKMGFNQSKNTVRAKSEYSLHETATWRHHTTYNMSENLQGPDWPLT